MAEMKQLNVTIPEKAARRIKGDAVALGITLNEYALAAFENFLAKPANVRRVCFDGTPKKIIGRKLKPN